MSKKRRTRAQKMRAQERRQQVPAQVSKPELAMVKSDEAAPAETDQVDAKSAVPRTKLAEPAVAKTKPANARQRSDLRLSLTIFGLLIAAQLMIWLVFSLTDIDAKLYNLIKL